MPRISEAERKKREKRQRTADARARATADAKQEPPQEPVDYEDLRSPPPKQQAFEVSHFMSGCNREIGAGNLHSASEEGRTYIAASYVVQGDGFDLTQNTRLGLTPQSFYLPSAGAHTSVVVPNTQSGGIPGCAYSATNHETVQNESETIGKPKSKSKVRKTRVIVIDEPDSPEIAQDNEIPNRVENLEVFLGPVDPYHCALPPNPIYAFANADVIELDIERDSTNVLGNGNCLFNFLSKAMKGHENDHASIRNEMCDALEAAADNPNSWVYNELEVFGDTREAILAYVNDMRRLTRWGEVPELNIFTRLYPVNVVILDLSARPPHNMIVVPKREIDDDLIAERPQIDPRYPTIVGIWVNHNHFRVVTRFIVNPMVQTPQIDSAEEDTDSIDSPLPAESMSMTIDSPMSHLTVRNRPRNLPNRKALQRKQTPPPAMRSEAQRKKDARSRDSSTAATVQRKRRSRDNASPANLERDRSSNASAHRDRYSYVPIPESRACKKRHKIPGSTYTFGCGTNVANHNPELYDSGDIGDKICDICHAGFLKSETVCNVCKDGRIQLPALKDDPPLLQELCDPDNRSAEAENFRKNIIKIDSLLSMGAIYRPPVENAPQHENPRGPPKPVLLNGHFSHFMGPLTPNDPAKYRNSSLYVMDPEDALGRRAQLDMFEGIDRDMFLKVDRLIRQCHPLARAFKFAHERFKQATEEAQASGAPRLPKFKMVIYDKRPSRNDPVHPHLLNPINPDEVFGIWIDSDPDKIPDDVKGICIVAQGNRLQKISIWNKNRDCIVNPLMYPNGDQTFGNGIPLFDTETGEFFDHRDAENDEPANAMDIGPDPEDPSESEPSEISDEIQNNDVEEQASNMNIEQDEPIEDENIVVNDIIVNADESAPNAEIDHDQAQDDAEDNEAHDLEEEPTLAPRQPRIGRARGRERYVAMRRWFNYHLAIRIDKKKHHFFWSKSALAQRCMIELMWRIMQNEEAYQKRLQSTAEWRRALPKNLQDALSRRLPHGKKLGSIFMMPKSNPLSRSYLTDKIEKACTIRRVLKPNARMFITMTLNPASPDIERNLNRRVPGTPEPYETIPEDTPENIQKRKRLRRNMAKIKPADRPDICDRYARDKFKELHRITEGPNAIFNEPIADVTSMEFQKRGLAHIHKVSMYHVEGIDPDSEEYINAHYSAEIPDKPSADDWNTRPEWAKSQQRYYDYVTKFMIHHCSEDSVCRRDGKCTKGYPKNFSDTSYVPESEGMTIYRRRSPQNGGNSFVKKVAGQPDVIIDNRYVVPHNRYLLLKFGCHVCCEHVNRNSIDKYIFKYQFKGTERCWVMTYHASQADGGEANWDEFGTVNMNCYMSAFQAYAHFSGMEFSRIHPTVNYLSVHLEDHQPIYFRQGDEQEAAERAQSSGPRTQLTAWMALCNSGNEIAKNLTFDQAYEHFVWNKGDKKWTPRKRHSKQITIIYTVPPNKPNQFALRLLAHKLKGVKSFEDMRTLNRWDDPPSDEGPIICDSFEEAARRRGLLQDNEIWIKTLEEAADQRYISQFINFFAQMLLYNTPPNSRELYDKFKNDMMVRPNPNRENDDEYREQRLLRRLSRIFQASSRRNSDFNLPDPNQENEIDIQEEIEIYHNPILDDMNDAVLDEQFIQKRHTDAINWYNQLNAEQKAFVDAIEEAYDQIKDGNRNFQRLFYLYGSGGTGKTFTYNTLIDYLREKKRIKSLACASTGIAATYLQNQYHRATTMHNLFRLQLDARRLPNVEHNGFTGRLLSDTDVIIIDEIGIADIRQLRNIDRLLKDLAPSGSPESKMPFGGKIVIFGGDHKQQFPVIKRGNIDDQANASFFMSNWYTQEKFKRFKLIRSMRLQENQELYSQWITDLGEGTNFIPGTDRIHLLDDNMAVYSEDELIAKVFTPEILENPEQASRRTILCPHNRTATQLNERILEMRSSTVPSKTYYSIDKSENFNPLDVNSPLADEINLNSVSKGTLPEHELKLKVGSPVMLLRNLSTEKGLSNGTILRVERLGDNIIWCRKQNGELEKIQRIQFEDDEKDIGGISFTRTQFPLRLAYAITITKSQGGTYDFVGANLLEDCFSHGQAYTLFSRVTSQQGIFVLTKKPPEGERPTIRNVVYDHFVRLRAEQAEANSQIEPNAVVEFDEDEVAYVDGLMDA